jgi:prenyltransferase beta subunit
MVKGKRTLLICALVVILCCVYANLFRATAAAQPVSGSGVPEAILYIKARQNSDGGFSEPGASSDPTTTSWALLAGSAQGEEPLNWQSSGAYPKQYLTSQAGSIRKLKDIELIALAITEAGGDPRNAAGIDLVSLGKANIASNGKIGADIAEHCWGMLFLNAAGETVPAKCTEWLVEQQRQDGGWGESDKVLVQDTGLAIEALTSTGEETGESLDAALKMLKARMNGDGGFKGPSKTSDAQTTSWAVRAITAAGEDPSSQGWSFHGNNPISFLNSLQSADGHFQYSKGVESQPAVTTAMASIALAGVDSSQDTSGDSPTAVDAGSAVAGDLGTAGADISRQGSSSSGSVGGPNVQVKVLKGPSSGAVGSVSGATGFWLFLTICAIYLGLLLVLVAAVCILVQRPRPPRGLWDDTQQYPGE